MSRADRRSTRREATTTVRSVVELAAASALPFVAATLLGLLPIGRQGGGPLQGLDDAVGRWYLRHRSPLVGVSKCIATTLDAAPLAVLCLVLSALAWTKLRSPRALLPLAAYVGGEFQVFAVREVVHRRRPISAKYPAPGAIPGVHETSYSFPSGHADAVTAVLFALLGAFALSAHRWWPWVVALAVSLFAADTRLVLGVHWMSDVVLGCCFGVAWGVSCARVAVRLGWPSRAELG